MAYDKLLAQKVRLELAGLPGIEEKKMFGGVGFLIHGNMACSILNDELIVRVGPDNYQEALNLPQARKFDLTGRSMRGWFMVSAGTLAKENELSAWIKRGVSFAKTLPHK